MRKTITFLDRQVAKEGMKEGGREEGEARTTALGHNRLAHIEDAAKGAQRREVGLDGLGREGGEGERGEKKR